MSEIAEAEERFLGRITEQNQFRDALRAIVDPSLTAAQKKDGVNPSPPPYVFLLYGEGGMGKTKLCQRFQAITTDEAEFRGRIKIIWLDWQERKHVGPGFDIHDAVSAETVFGNICDAFREKGFGDKFDLYEKAVTKRKEVEKKVDQVLAATRGEVQDRYAELRKIGAEGLASLLRAGLPGVAGASLPAEPMAKVFETIIEGGAIGLARVRDLATTLFHAKLNHDEFDLFVLPHETLARRLAHGISAAAEKKPILLVLDQYEVVDRADYWLRSLIKHAGLRVIWVISGRHNLADSGRRANIHFSGYREDKVLSKLLRVIPLTEFSAGDVMEYFKFRVPARPLDDSTAQSIQRATLGIPLAVKEAAAIWAKPGTILNDITSAEALSSHHDAFVEKITESFLMYGWSNQGKQKDWLQIFVLALAYPPDAELLAAMLDTDELEHELTELKKRHSFVLVSEMTLHVTVRTFVREYLHLKAKSMRAGKDIRGANERAVKYLKERLAKLDTQLPTMEDRLDDKNWRISVIALSYHSFWLDEDDGWKILLPAFLGGLVYDRDFAGTLLNTAGLLSRTLTEKEKGLSRLKILQAGLNTKPEVELETALLDELESSKHCWVDDGCLSERRAILALLRGRVALREGKLAKTQPQLEEAEKGLPPKSKTLKRQLGAALYALSGELMWPDNASDAVYSADADRALAKAAKFLPDMAGPRYYIGVSNAKVQRHEPAIAEFKAAIDLGPKLAAPHNGLGNVYYQQGHYERAIIEYQTAIDLDPKDAAPHNGLGNVYYQQRLYEQAIAEYQAAIDLEPKLAAPYEGLSYVYRQQNQYEPAITAFQTAIDLDPRLAAPHNGLGNIYRWQGYYEQAITEYKAAIALDPQYAMPHRGLGDMYRQQGHKEQAIAEYKIALALDPNTPHTSLGMSWQIIKQVENERQAYLDSTKLQPEDANDPARLTSVCRKLSSKNELIES